MNKKSHFRKSKFEDIYSSLRMSARKKNYSSAIELQTKNIINKRKSIFNSIMHHELDVEVIKAQSHIFKEESMQSDNNIIIENK